MTCRCEMVGFWLSATWPITSNSCLGLNVPEVKKINNFISTLKNRNFSINMRKMVNLTKVRKVFTCQGCKIINIFNFLLLIHDNLYPPFSKYTDIQKELKSRIKTFYQNCKKHLGINFIGRFIEMTKLWHTYLIWWKRENNILALPWWNFSIGGMSKKMGYLSELKDGWQNIRLIFDCTQHICMFPHGTLSKVKLVRWRDGQKDR